VKTYEFKLGRDNRILAPQLKKVESLSDKGENDEKMSAYNNLLAANDAASAQIELFASRDNTALSPQEQAAMDRWERGQERYEKELRNWESLNAVSRGIERLFFGRTKPTKPTVPKPETGKGADHAPDRGIVVLSDLNVNEAIGTVRFNPNDLDAPGEGRLPEGVGRSEIESDDWTKLRVSEPHQGRQQFVRESRVVEQYRVEQEKYINPSYGCVGTQVRDIIVPSKYAFLLQQYTVDAERETVTYSEWKRDTSQL